jgi:GT2 family glycosyltransferase
MAQVLMKDQQLAILGANMLTADGDEQKLWLKLPHFYNSCLDCCWIGRQINKTLFKTAIDKSISFMKVETIPGSFFGVRADIIQKLNYLDENVFLFYEENILGFKVKQMGMYSAIMTKHNYIHAHNATIKKNISILNGYKVNLQSKLYFEQQYRKIGCLRTALLTLCMKYGVLEFSLALRLKSLFKL